MENSVGLETVVVADTPHHPLFPQTHSRGNNKPPNHGFLVFALSSNARAQDEIMHRPNPYGLEFDNMYLDLNGVVHVVSHAADTPASSEGEIFFRVCRYIDVSCSLHGNGVGKRRGGGGDGGGGCVHPHN